jgi:hypothetical protein
LGGEAGREFVVVVEADDGGGGVFGEGRREEKGEFGEECEGWGRGFGVGVGVGVHGLFCLLLMWGVHFVSFEL